MEYEKKASVHAAISDFLGEGCPCVVCLRAEKERLVPEISERIELIALKIVLGENDLEEANYEVDLMTDFQVRAMLPGKKERLRLIVEKKKTAREKQKNEPIEEFHLPGNSVVGHTVRGGRRVVRKGSEMGG